jgi:hypothetical protein
VIPDPSPPFEFEPSGAIRERIERLLVAADAQGVLAEAGEALVQIVRRLVHRPRRWGDPIRNLAHAHLTQYRGVHWNLACYYAVHNRVPIVFLTDITPLEESPLFGT